MYSAACVDAWAEACSCPSNCVQGWHTFNKGNQRWTLAQCRCHAECKHNSQGRGTAEPVAIPRGHERETPFKCSATHQATSCVSLKSSGLAWEMQCSEIAEERRCHACLVLVDRPRNSCQTRKCNERRKIGVLAAGTHILCGNRLLAAMLCTITLQVCKGPPESGPDESALG